MSIFIAIQFLLNVLTLTINIDPDQKSTPQTSFYRLISEPPLSKPQRSFGTKLLTHTKQVEPTLYSQLDLKRRQETIIDRIVC